MEMSPELKARHEEHDKWVLEVRDPAQENSEGYRVVATKRCSAEYEIAQLSDGFAIHWSLQCGNGGCAVPWIALETRDECLKAFTDAVKSHFSDEKKMLEKLDGGLFGFIEPSVAEERTQLGKEIQEIRKAHGL